MWLTLQSCFNQIILHHGDNDYSIEHISKATLEWAGQLLDVLDMVDDTYQTNNESDSESNSYNKSNSGGGGGGGGGGGFRECIGLISFHTQDKLVPDSRISTIYNVECFHFWKMNAYRNQLYPFGSCCHHVRLPPQTVVLLGACLPCATINIALG